MSSVTSVSDNDLRREWKVRKDCGYPAFVALSLKHWLIAEGLFQWKALSFLIMAHSGLRVSLLQVSKSRRVYFGPRLSMRYLFVQYTQSVKLSTSTSPSRVPLRLAFLLPLVAGRLRLRRSVREWGGG